MRYIIGVDLGTTNSCVSYIDTQHAALAIQPFRIHQLVFESHIEARHTLPSFCYLPAADEWPAEALKMPWQRVSPTNFVGLFAQELGAKTPTRLIQSAKSWLCHPFVDRREKFLPIEAADTTQRVSPVEVTSYYLNQIKDSWNLTFATHNPDAQFEDQEIILTVPASFDEVARTLTIEAAKLAGFVNLTLLEEPQAAFYSWLSQHEHQWQQMLKKGDLILVCDVGGGTTDFSLMEVTGDDHQLTIQRKSIGDHLLLGGDNIDNTLTYYLEKKLGRSLSTNQWLQLRHESRLAKEFLLQSDQPQLAKTILIQGTGSQLIGKSLSVELSKAELEKLILEGFFGQYRWDEAVQLTKARGLRNMGLPYEDDPSITKHLAVFLHKQRDLQGPDYILFNGGTLKAIAFQQALIGSLKRWFPQKNLQTLTSVNLDLAVGRGAAYYGKARRGLGARIRGGIGRGFYLKIQTGEKAQALTLLPRGSDEGSFYQPETIFRLTPNRPVSFQIYHSHTRLHDQPGDLIDIDQTELQPLPPIYSVFRFGKQQTAGSSSDSIPVKIKALYTSLGILEVSLASMQTDHQWALEFQLTNAEGQNNSLASLQEGRSDTTFDKQDLEQAKQILIHCFNGEKPLKQLIGSLEQEVMIQKNDWPLSLLRGLTDQLLLLSGRYRSAEHEQRWWNLLGFLLRPGFGYPLDDYRMKEAWKVILSDIKNQRSLDLLTQKWICYRRVAGGLNKGQQAQLAAELISSLPLKQPEKLAFKKNEAYLFQEKIRLLGAFERLELSTKIRLGEFLMARIERGEASVAEFWALSRIGARHLFYGSPLFVIPSNTVITWIQRLMQVNHEQIPFLISHLGRKTDQRELNIPDEMIAAIISHYEGNLFESRLTELLTSQTMLRDGEQDQIFGDHLPTGLHL